MVIPTYDRAATVVGAIESVLAQSVTDLEVVVVDDGSSDDTETVVTGFADPRVRYVRRPNGGISAARNTGAAHASGRLLAFLDDDDRLRPDYLARLGAVLDETDAAVATCGAELRSLDGAHLGMRLPRPTSPAFDGVVAWFTSGTVVMEREAFVAVGGYLEGLQCSHQTELAFRLLDWCATTGRTVAAVEEPLVDLIRAAPEGRPEASPAKLLSGTEEVLARHPARFEADPALRADFHAIAGVAAARLGDRRTARRHLWQAVRATPGDPRQLARLAVASVGPLADRVWRSPDFAR